MEPQSVFNFFGEICKIPRESKHEEKIIAYLQKFAQERSLECKTDEAGNVLIIRPASEGYETAPTVILQSHSDMVCEKNSDSNHNFDTDPINYVIEDGWMIAKETTLGADCGIGIAAQLAILDDKILKLPKIEALFTVDEETGLTGAMSLKPGFITGKYLINLDSEDEGEIFIGCAGGIDTTARFEYSPYKLSGDKEILKVKYFGLTGGHSGDDINKNRANANQLLARYLFLINEKFGLDLCKIDGGNKRNAIAREAVAIIAIPSGKKAEATQMFSELLADMKAEYSVSEPNLGGSIEGADFNGNCIEKSVADKLILALNASLHGVLAMSQDIENFVETSTNLASIKMDEDKCVITVCTSQRSSLNSARFNSANRMEALFRLAGAKVTHESQYPGWKPNLNSKLLIVGRESYKELFGTEPVVRAIHAGLECGLFLDTYPDLDMISFGPTLRGVHAPGERLEISTVDKFWKLLIDILKRVK
jgi:dipeptidase D